MSRPESTIPNSHMLLLLLAALVVAGCFIAGCMSSSSEDSGDDGNGPPPAAGNGGDPRNGNGNGHAQGNGGGPPKLHVWNFLNQNTAESPEYLMYTYVLFGRRVGESIDLPVEIRSRYENLLMEIVGSTGSAEETPHLPEESNIFYIPATATNPREHPSLQNYDSAYARRILNALGQSVSNDSAVLDRLTNKPGPFLVSTLQPIGALEAGEVEMLYADLSETNPRAIPEVVVTYKRRLTKEGVDGIDRLSSFRLWLLTKVLNADQNVRQITVKVAELRKLLKG